MSEISLVWLITGGGLGVLISSFFYALGGRVNRLLFRRILSSLVLASTVNALFGLLGKWHPLQLVLFPGLYATWCLGYGADTVGEKILKRSIVSAAVLFLAFLLCLPIGGNTWFVLVFHACLALTTIYLGTRNPVQASAEEFLICSMFSLPFVAYPFV